jgi:glutamate racemase
MTASVTSQPNQPIGVFDSGVGGLTVVRQLQELYPSEPIIYFGDTARVPYGTKSAETIQRYAQEDTEFLLSFQPKAIVVACNTASALALQTVKNAAGEVPVFGVLEPGARAALKATRNGKVGVIGTTATVASQAYQQSLKKLQPNLHVVSNACPLFVPLAEEGMFDHPATRLIAADYLAPLIEEQVDTVVLGCTHYPLLRKTLATLLGPSITIIDSGEALARELGGTLQLRQGGSREEPTIYVSDLPLKFQRTAEQFLGRTLTKTVQSHAVLV